jgi:hypothetical protein
MDFLILSNPCSDIMNLGLTHPPKEMSASNLSGGG